MKYNLLLSLIFFSALHAAAQNDTTIIYLDGNDKPCPEVKAVRYALQNKESDHWKKVVFDKYDDKPVYGAYYLDSMCTQFDGPYSSFHKSGKISTKGRYADNKKFGNWKSYSGDGKLTDSAYYKDGFIYGTALRWYDDGSIEDSLIFEDYGKGVCKGYWSDGKPKQSGNFIAGKKSGTWTYNYKSGMKCQEVKYEADSALSYTCYDEAGSIQTSNCVYEREANFKGGEKAWLKYLSNKLSTVVLPKEYYNGGIFGTVYVQFIVDTEGKIKDAKIVASVDPDLDEVAKNIIRQSPRWEPAVQYNRPVNAYRRQPITFAKVE